jgi:outer membrane protein, multidrug efflux system
MNYEFLAGRRLVIGLLLFCLLPIINFSLANAQVTWRQFNDVTLDSLIELGNRQNVDVLLAQSRLAEARSRVRVAESFLLPSVQLAPAFTTQSLAPNRPFAFPTVTDAQRQRFQLNTFNVPVNATYELDVFRRLRQTIRVADLQAQATDADVQFVRLTIASEIARLYGLIRANEAEQGVFRRNLLARDTTVAIIRDRFRVGLVNRIDVLRAETDSNGLRVTLRGLERARTELVNALAQLIGADPVGFTLPVAGRLPTLPVATPDESSVRQRPDIVSAERLAQAAAVNAAVARAARKPRIVVGGSAGFLSGSIGPLLFPGSATFLLGLTMSVPVYEGNRNRENVILADQQRTTAQTAIEQRLQLARRDADIARDNLTALREQLDLQQQTLALARQTERYTRELYVRGLTTYLDVLDAQRTILASEQAVVQFQGLAFGQTVALWRALGAGQ